MAVIVSGDVAGYRLLLDKALCSATPMRANSFCRAPEAHI